MVILKSLTEFILIEILHSLRSLRMTKRRVHFRLLREENRLIMLSLSKERDLYG